MSPAMDEAGEPEAVEPDERSGFDEPREAETTAATAKAATVITR